MSYQIESETSSEELTEIEEANLFTVIRNRRATRSYLGKPVSDKIIETLIDFSIQAPSAMNLQPWSFVVIQNQKILKEISDSVKKNLFSNPDFSKEVSKRGLHFFNETDADLFYGATTLIVICAKNSSDKQFSTEADCFLAAENFMLAATGMGLATCPIGLVRNYIAQPEISKKLGVLENYTPVLPIVIGYAGTQQHEVARNPAIIKWIR